MWDDVRNAKNTVKQQSAYEKSEQRGKPYDDSFGQFGDEKKEQK